MCHFISKSYRFSLSHGLGRRKILFEKRKKISDYALVMGMFGIIIMVIENELSSAGVYNKEDIMSTGLKTLISISTVVLLVLIVAYHMLEIQVHMGSEACLALMDWSRGGSLLFFTKHGYNLRNSSIRNRSWLVLVLKKRTFKEPL